MSQTNNDIFPKEEKEKAKRKKIAEMNAVTAQAILKIILNQLGAKYEQYHFIKYCVLIIPIGNSGIEISLSDSAIIDQRQIIQDKLTKLYDFISGGASVGEVVTYCRDNRIEYLGYKARKYAIIDKISKEINASSFESVFVTERVTSIGEYAFWFCKLLKSIQLPEGVTSIGDAAFWGCESLKSIELPAEVKSIGRQAFYCCRQLESIQLPEGLKSIGDGTFENCTSLESIQLPEGMKSIWRQAFYHCTQLKSIQLSERVTSIGFRAFTSCTSLENITFSGTREQWEKIEKGTNCYYKIPAKVIHCTDGDVEI